MIKAERFSPVGLAVVSNNRLASHRPSAVAMRQIRPPALPHRMADRLGGANVVVVQELSYAGCQVPREVQGDAARVTRWLAERLLCQPTPRR